jgi:hypothetical protein
LQLARDFKRFKEIQLFKNKSIEGYINDENRTVEELNNVSWDMIIPT